MNLIFTFWTHKACMVLLIKSMLFQDCLCPIWLTSCSSFSSYLPTYSFILPFGCLKCCFENLCFVFLFVSIPLLIINGLQCYSNILWSSLKQKKKRKKENQTFSWLELFILMLDEKVIWGNLPTWEKKIPTKRINKKNINQPTPPCKHHQVRQWCLGGGRAIIAVVSCVYLLCQPPLSPFILCLSVLRPKDDSGQQYCQLRPQAVSKSHSFRRNFRWA